MLLQLLIHKVGGAKRFLKQYGKPARLWNNPGWHLPPKLQR